MNQDIFTFVIVLAAVSYALFSVIRALKPGRSSSCGDCGGCAAKKDLREYLTLKNNKHVTGKHLSQL